MDTRPDVQDQKKDELATARAQWEFLAANARAIHCPIHGVPPWRVAVTGESVKTMNLQIYGCCAALGQAVSEMVNSDPRVSGPR